MMLPLWVLAILSIIAAFFELPHNWVHHPVFSNFVQQVLPETKVNEAGMSEALHQFIASALTVVALFVAYQIVTRNAMKSLKDALYNFLTNAWYFDKLYDKLFVKPFIFITRINKADAVDKIYNGISRMTTNINTLLSFTQSGALRWYLVALVGGGILFISLYWLT